MNVTGIIAMMCLPMLLIPTIMFGVFWNVEKSKVADVEHTLEFTKTHCVVSGAYPVSERIGEYCTYSLYCPSKEYIIENFHNSTDTFFDLYGIPSNQSFVDGVNGNPVDDMATFGNNTALYGIENEGCVPRSIWGDRLFLCYVPPDPSTEFVQIALESMTLPSGKISAAQAQADIDTADRRLTDFLDANSGLSTFGILFIVFIVTFCLCLLWMLLAVALYFRRKKLEKAERDERALQARKKREAEEALEAERQERRAAAARLEVEQRKREEAQQRATAAAVVDESDQTPTKTAKSVRKKKKKSTKSKSTKKNDQSEVDSH